MRKFLLPILLIITNCIIGGTMVGCVYSFTGSSVPPHLKTIAIPLCGDQTGSGEAGVGEKVTKQLLELFTSDNSLEVTEKNISDSIVETTIVSLRDDPLVVSAGEQVSARRVTITVRAIYTDLKLRKKMWQKDFSNTGDYTQGSSNRTEAIDQSVKKVAEDILLETVSGW